MQLAQTTGSYNAAFKALSAMWRVFSTVASALGYPQYDYVKGTYPYIPDTQSAMNRLES